MSSYFPDLNIELIKETRATLFDSHLVLEMLKSAFPTYYREPKEKKFTKPLKKKKKQGFWNKGVLKRYGYYVQQSINFQELYIQYMVEPLKAVQQ